MSAPTPPSVSGRVLLVNDRDQIAALQDLVVESAEDMGYSRSARFALRLAIEEAITNAFKHGHRGLPPSTPIDVEYAIVPDRIRIAIQDRGPGFKPDTVPDPTLDENLEMPGGRGLVLMRAYMSRVAYNEAGNRVELELRRAEGD